MSAKRNREDLSEDEDDFSISSDQAVSYKQDAPQPFINIPSSVTNPKMTGEISPLDGISGFDHARLSPQVLREHDLRQPSYGFGAYRTNSGNMETDTVTTLTASSNNPTPVKTRKRVRFTSTIRDNSDDSDDMKINNDLNDITTAFNMTNIDDSPSITPPPNSPVSDDANVGGSTRKRRQKHYKKIKTRKTKKTKKDKKNKKTRKLRSRKNKHSSRKRISRKNKK